MRRLGVFQRLTFIPSSVEFGQLAQALKQRALTHTKAYVHLLFKGKVCKQVTWMSCKEIIMNEMAFYRDFDKH